MIATGSDTALEIVDIFTNQNLKFNQGEKEWSNFFSNISKQFAVMENIHLFNPLNFKNRTDYYNQVEEDKSLVESHKLTKKLILKLDVINVFNAFTQSINIVNGKLDDTKANGYVLIEINLDKSSVTTKFYGEKDNIKAEQDYTQKEQEIVENKQVIIALVSSNSIGGIKEAYPNYFADSTDFLNHLNVISESNL